MFRGLYAEKKVIAEERRLRVENAPLGRFQQEFARRALSNNYQRPIIGETQDFDGLGRVEVGLGMNEWLSISWLWTAVFCVGCVSSCPSPQAGCTREYYQFVVLRYLLTSLHVSGG